MDPNEFAHWFFQAGAGQKWKAFTVVAAAPWDLSEQNYRAIETVDPWLASTLFYWKVARQCRRAALAGEILSEHLKPWADAVLAQDPPAELELLTIHVRILTSHLRVLKQTTAPGRSDPLVWSICHLRLGDAWQQIAPRGADRQAARAQEYYEEAIQWAPNPLIKGWAANNLACMLHKSADLTKPDAASEVLVEANNWAQKAKIWYNEIPAGKAPPGGSALPYLTAAMVLLAMATVEFGDGKTQATVQVAKLYLLSAWEEIRGAKDHADKDRADVDCLSPEWPAIWLECKGDAWATEAEIAQEPEAIDRHRSEATRCYKLAIESLRGGHSTDTPPVGQKLGILHVYTAQITQKLGILHAVHGEARIETSKGRESLGHAAAIFQAAASQFTEMGYKEHAITTYHDLGLILKRLGDFQGAFDAHKRAVDIVDGLTSSGPVGPDWVVWFSRLAKVIDHSLSAFAQSRHPEIAVAQMAVSFGRDADDLATIRAQLPDPKKIPARVYEHYLDLEYWIRIYDGVNVGAMGPKIPKQKLVSYRARRRELDVRASKLRRRFQRIDDSWKPMAGTPSLDELRGLADRAGAPVVGLHVVADGTVAGAILPGGGIRATLLEGLTTNRLKEIMMDQGGWIPAYDDFKNSGSSQQAWLKFHLCVDKALELLGRSLWQPLVQWLAKDPQNYPPSRRDRLSQDDSVPPPLILIPAGPALDVLPLLAMTYTDLNHEQRVAADDYRIVCAPTFRLLGHCLDRRDRWAEASKQGHLWFTVPDDADLSWSEATELYLSSRYPDLQLAGKGSRSEIRHKLPCYEISFVDGHAGYDAAAPLKSWFKLADEKMLLLFRVAGMDLTGVKLFGHLGCETTLSGWNNHASGMAGFAGSLLAAGVGSVIGSLWSRETSVVSALLNCRLYEKLACQAAVLTPGQALWRAAAWLRTASLKELENSIADLTKDLDKQKQETAIDQLHTAIIEDFGKLVDHAPLRRPRHWAGLIAYGAG
jgi:hypothetical protein